MAPRLWLWLHVATAMVAVSCTYHHERHPHIRRSHTEHHHFLGNFPLNGTKGKDSHISLDSRPSSGPLPYSAPYEDRAQPTPSGHSTRRHQRHQHRRRTHSHRVPDIIYSFGSQSAAKLLYRGKGYRVGPYTGYVDVWTIPRQSRPQYLPPPRLTPPPSPPPSPPHLQRQEEHFPEGTAFARVLIAPEPSNAVSPAEPRTCLRCPKDRTVWVGPGFSCAEVPKPRLRPCSRLASLPGEVRMTATAGPQPGSLVMEGVYQMGFTFQAPGIAPQSCHYKLRVKVRRCPALQRLHNGGARCSRGRHWGSRCRFFCKPGYALEQRVAARCAIHDGVRVTWTPHPAPVCRAKNDSAPTATTNAIIPDTVMPTRPATEASVPTTPSKKVFPATGSPRPPKRWKQLACRWPKAPLHGWVSCDRGATRKARVVAREGTRCRQGCRWAPQSVVTHFSCVAGAWQGRKALGCTGPPQASTEPAPTELPRTTESGCEGPSPVPNSALECSADANTLGRRPVDTICRHVCDKGYDVLPSQLPLAQVTCLANGKWHQEDQPRCVKSGCASPVILPNSLLDCSKQINHLGNRPTGTICKVACKEGFILSPNQQHVNEIICEEDGTWNQTAEFECHKSGCSSPDLVPDSSLECSNDANHLGHHPTGTSCKIVCNMGLGLPPDMQALNHFVCQEDGTWNQTTQLECSSIGCPSSKQVPGSSLECSMAANRFGKHPTGTICKVVCADGLSLPSSLQSLNQFVCQEDGTWNQTTQLECRNNGCPSPKPVPDSSLDCSADVDQFGQWPTGTACQVVCADGLALPSSLQPLNYFMCQEDGTWNQTTQLECRNNGCPSPKPVPDSSLDCSPDVDQFGQWPIGTACQIVCADGLALPSSLQPLNYIVCQEDGTWNQTTQLECRNNGCPSPNPVPDSSLDCSADVDQFGQWPTGTACQVVCADGLALPSSLQPLNYFVCQEDGTWNQTAQLECRNSGCARPDPVPGASLECSKDGEDLGKWPTGSICNVVCNEGLALPLNLQSLNLFVCLEDGTWNQTAQLECRETGCATPDPVPESSLKCSKGANQLGNRPTGTVCEVRCNEGFTLPLIHQSSSQFVCQEDGVWNQTAQLECIKSGCVNLDLTPNSSLECSHEVNNLGNRPTGTICKFVCSKGFTLPSNQQSFDQFVCQGDGTWDHKTHLECHRVTCDSPPKVSNSVLECSNGTSEDGKWQVGTLCRYTCNEGYAVPKIQDGLNSFICREDGTWSLTDQLLCEEAGCKSPTQVEDSVLNCTAEANSLGRWPTGAICSYDCKEGYGLATNQLPFSRIACHDDGTWNQTEQLRCKKTGCEDPSAVQFSMVNCSGTANTFGRWPVGTECSHVCDEGYAVSRHEVHLNLFICLDDGTWNQTEGLHCRETGCESPQVVQNSVLHCSESANVIGNWPAGTTCQHICDNGFVIPQSQLGLGDITCLDDGTWNETGILQCLKLRDPQLSQGCKDEVVVVDGHNVSFPVTIEAPTFKAFNGTNAAVRCTATHVTTYGTHVIVCDAVDTELQSTSSCTYNVTALASGCPPLQSDPYSRVSCSADRNVTEGHLHPVGDVCEYICQRHGYVIPQSKVDSAVKECLPNGSWSNDDFDLCEEQLVPLRVSGCEDMEFGTDELGNTTVPRPLFRTPSGLVNATCTPEMLVDFGDHVIHCVAEDHDLRSSASCSFKVIVKGETVPRLRETGPGCVDVQEVHDKYPVHLKPPAFEAASGGAALVICDPATLLGPGAYNVTCTARDNKTQAETQCAYVVNARQIEQFRESQCLSLRAPANGDIRCKRRMGLIKCRFSCFPDHVMSTKSFPLLARGYVVCDRAQRDRFDFQEEYGLDELPACTRLPTPTYFQGSLTFHVGLPSCSLENLHTDFMPTLTEALLDRAADVCLQADCDNVTFMCETAVLRNSSDPSSASDAMKVVWTVQARHNVNASYDIPEAETVIEQIQVLTHDIVTSDPGFYQEIAKVGGDLWRDSFRQSKFTLVCGSRGFTIDDHTAHCVPCPSGTFEEHGSCHPCPQNHYQDSEGQTSCKPCPKHTFSFEGAKMVKDCTEFAGPNVPPPARDAPAWQPHERHGPCSPNPCRHQGICYLQRGGYTCLCQQHYRGRHCEESA
ncbi:complement receptor type 1-like isoform X2 [Dermacentor albipictus]|uniref:complement receptor type 1-like isoform X2 n=1 Tax=Dermacentor albipictus TaxID=60249 RepID=UPI0031FC47B9